MIITVVSPTNTAQIINSKRRNGDFEKKLFFDEKAEFVSIGLLSTRLKVKRWSFMEELILPNFSSSFHHPDPKLNL